ncbi:MAG: 3-phosphoshikimate 1-carboxyvinyltransferase [Clostridia bacterium]|nr:3-phosphoshikimate 1-carboxyvinyltransferase [Clostridia bacterium]
MIERVQPGPRTGRVSIPASKSRAHRLLICAALSGQETELICQGISKDIEATMACLRGMGVAITQAGDRIRVAPGPWSKEKKIVLPCGESGSTLRFLLPVVGALGLRGEFRMEGRLPQRPLQPLWDLLEMHGMELHQEGEQLGFSGQLRPGNYEIPGNISSQYVSGLLFALPLLAGESSLKVTGAIESADYIAMTEDALSQFGLPLAGEGYDYQIPGGGYPAAFAAGQALRVESDWSSAAFFLSLGALSPAGVTVTGMDLTSRQGDRRILELLAGFGAEVTAAAEEITIRRGEMHGQRIDAAAIPDLVPILAVVAASCPGETIIEHAERLRLKESDRLMAVSTTLNALGAEVRERTDGLEIIGKAQLAGGEVSSFNDHRIAMSAAVAASLCQHPVTIQGAESTEKSFPGFWEKLKEMTIVKGGGAA